jgi:RNA polymerase sigma-70 factor (ECF subfamily)
MPDDFASPAEALEPLRGWLRRRAAVLLDGRLRGKVDPSDVVQETLLKAVRHADQWRGRTEEEWRAWLRRILANTLADLVRRFLAGQKRDVDLELSLEQAVEQSSARLEGLLANGTAAPEDEAAHNESLLWLAEALAALPADQQQAVRLKYLHGLSVGAIAGRLDRTRAAVAGLLRRGLEALRQQPGCRAES